MNDRMSESTPILWATRFLQVAAREGIGDLRKLQTILRQWRSDGPLEQARLVRLFVDQKVLTQKQVNWLVAKIESDQVTADIPGFELSHEVGAGGRGRVFKAIQKSLNRVVAIKIVRLPESNSPKAADRFLAEAAAVARLSHNNIVQAYDVGLVGSYQYFAMEFVDGQSLASLLSTKGRLSESDAIRLMLQVCEGLEHAHATGIIHCDVKPANILIDRAGRAKLADFGIARLLDEQSQSINGKGAFGTPLYSAPEQFRGGAAVDARTDVYGVGASLYHMVTGSPPFMEPDYANLMRAHLSKAVMSPDHMVKELSVGISQIIEKALAKSPQDRYQRVTDLIVDLRAVFNGESPVLAAKEMEWTQLAAMENDAPSDYRRIAWMGNSVAWILLGASVLLNIILLLLYLSR